MCRVDAKKKAIEKQLKTEKNPAKIAKLKDQIKAVEAEGKEGKYPQLIPPSTRATDSTHIA